MRVLFTSLIASSVVLIHVLDNPGRISSGLGNIKQEIIRVLNTKEVRIQGLKVLSRTEIERSLPLSKSVGWWMVNETSIKARVAENPWVSGVEVESCAGALLPKYGCFVVTVQERGPRFLAVVDNERWIIGEDGALIVPASSPDMRLPEESLKGLVPLSGLASRVSAPERSRAQLSLAQGAISVLERSVQRSVRSISFEGKGDMSVAFERVPFPVVFSASSDSVAVIEDQGLRLKALLSQLKDRLGEIDKVDLAFSKVGVVKFRTPAPE
jgi:hypothetical protein